MKEKKQKGKLTSYINDNEARSKCKFLKCGLSQNDSKSLLEFIAKKDKKLEKYFHIEENVQLNSRIFIHSNHTNVYKVDILTDPNERYNYRGYSDDELDFLEF